MQHYSIGLDFGSLSGRALLLNVQTGEETAESVVPYAHGVMSETLPDGTPLGSNWALQHPADYWKVLQTAIPDVLKKSGVLPEQVIGIGVDFTASTVLPVAADGTPLCCFDEFSSEPHAYVKMWKHHAAQPFADEINRKAAAFNAHMLDLFGGKVSSEWLIPKALETLRLAPAVYQSMDYFVEAADWVVWKLCGNLVRNACLAGYKALWNKQKGYPSNAFFKALDARMEHFVEEKLAGKVLPCGTIAGRLTEEAAQQIGLKAGTPVSVAGADAHSAIPGCGVCKPGHLLMVMGTSTCHLLMDTVERAVPGICGVVEDGMLPGFVSYEAGQSCLGDHFDWLQRACLPDSVVKEAADQGISPLAWLSEKAAKQQVGENGLLALDFWNGNRSVLDNGDLSGLLLGMTLDTKPEDIYRALVEATAFGSRIIIERFREYGVPINRVTVCGGIPHKNPFLLQVYADVIGLPLCVSATKQAGARGSAIYGAVAAGILPLEESVQQLGAKHTAVVYPNKENQVRYQALYEEYRRLYYYFGTENPVMSTLKSWKK